MKKIILVFVFLFSVWFLPEGTWASSVVNITKDGSASVTEAKVMQMAGGTMYTRLYWGDAFVRLLVKTNNKTQFYRGTGEETTLSEISVGNLLDISGELESASDSLTLIAKSISNSSIQKKQTIISGKVLSVDVGGSKFSIDSPKLGIITVNVRPETSFMKGNRILNLSHVYIGETITKASGDYDLNTKTMFADNVVTYWDLSQYKAKNFVGKIEAITSANLPTSLTVLVGKTSYKVNLKEKSSILNKNKGAVSLSRFVVGDSVRFYGAIQEVDEPIIEAEILRNMSL